MLRRTGTKIAAFVIIISVIMSLFPSALPVSAAETSEEKTSPKVYYVISYEEETITVDPDCMYALKADSDKGDKESWYPIIGTEINISKYIPKSGKTYTIALRYADDVLKDGKYVSRTEVKLSARPEIKPLKGQVEYDTEKESFVNKSSSPVEIFVGDSTLAITLGKAGSKSDDVDFIANDTEKMSMDLFPAGSAFTYRVRWVEDTLKEDGSVDRAGTFASLPGKSKVSAPPKAPKITLENQAEKTKKGVTTPAYDYFKGTSDKIEVFIGTKEMIGTNGDNYEEDVWVKIPSDKKNIKLEDLKAVRAAEIKKITDAIEASSSTIADFYDGIVINYKDNDINKDKESYTIIFRTAAGKKPASTKNAIIIPVDKYKIVPIVSFENKNISSAAATDIKFTLKSGTFNADAANAAVTDLLGLTDETNITYAFKTDGTPKDGGTEFTITVTTTKPAASDSSLDKTIKELKIAKAYVQDDEGEEPKSDVSVTGTITIKIEKETAGS